MKRTTVKLPDELDARLRHEAKRLGVTVSELVREAIERRLTPDGQRRFLSVAAGRSDGPGVARRIEELLEEEASTGRFGAFDR
jgi:Arc/MetJ-type ribon-helix-helix transcriptional regulator